MPVGGMSLDEIKKEKKCNLIPTNMLTQLFTYLRQDQNKWNIVKNLFLERDIPARTILLQEGEIAQNIYFIKKGCLRLWFNNDGKDVTFQFFFENRAVSSIESFMGRQPSSFTLESIEPSTVIVLAKEDFDTLFQYYPQLKDGLQAILFQRMGNYDRLFLSRIKDNPQKRYEDLLKNHPEIIRRIPQHYIASYLGITSVSLSRIKNKR